MLKFGVNYLMKNLSKSFVDNVINQRVTPKIGSVVYCELFFGLGDHSGIYLGDDQIAHLDGSGQIEVVSTIAFLNRLHGFNSAMSIYVSCHDNNPVGNQTYAERAKNYIGKRRDYHVLLDNCHQFTSGCITGDFENADNYMIMLKSTALKSLGANNWLVWQR
ncbi:MAG: lecithin retinol acyltransferase family protein [Aeromonas sp.]